MMSKERNRKSSREKVSASAFLFAIRSEGSPVLFEETIGKDVC